MSRRRSSRLAAALALAGLVPLAAAVAQGALSGRAAPPSPAPPPAAALKAAYRLVLTSTWPQESTPDGCRNGGGETVEGALTRRADGRYAGSFARRTQLLFCGTHGSSARSCALKLNGQGTVAMAGVVLDDETSPSGRSLRVTWTPLSAHGATVSGACPAAFKDAVRAMYLSTPHAAEFPLPLAGRSPRAERLENYAWQVELE